MRLFLAFIVFSISLATQAQMPLFIGMHKTEVEKTMTSKYPDFAQNTDFKNAKFKYLKYVDRMGDETFLVFLSDGDTCTVTKLMSGYDNEETRLSELNAAYKKNGADKWLINRNNKTYNVELKKEEWFFSIIVKQKIN